MVSHSRTRLLSSSSGPKLLDRQNLVLVAPICCLALRIRVVIVRTILHIHVSMCPLPIRPPLVLISKIRELSLSG